MAEVEHQDGILERYIISRGVPDSIQVTSKELARYYASKMAKESRDLDKEETVDLSRKGFTYADRLKARDALKIAYRKKFIFVDGKKFRVWRVEDFPEYHIALRPEVLNGTD